MKNRITPVLLALMCLLPLTVRAQDDSGGGAQPPQKDPMSYSYLEVNRLSVHSDFFNDRSTGNGVRFSYDFSNAVYLFGQWNKLDFDTLPGSENLMGVAIGTHQAYNDRTSFFVDVGYYRDALSASLGSRSDNFWRVDYGFRGMLTNYLELDGAIFTERNTDFGRRPFGERLGLGFKSQYVGVMVSGEHTANGNRSEVSLTWFY